MPNSPGNGKARSAVPVVSGNWKEAPPLKHILSPSHANLVDYYPPFEKVERIADFVLPLHDMKVFEKKCYS